MSRYEEGLRLIEESCGNGKDNVIALSTIGMEPGDSATPCPYVRDVDAYYEDGVFYVTTWAKSNKIQQITQNNNVAFAVCFEGISGNGVGENLGWVLDPKNAEIRTKLRKAFAEWYDQANNEQDKSCVILAIRITKGTIFRDHGAVRYDMDFVNKLEITEGKISL
ncbi:pyridoxamine 5'-phosphate oxidase family protein [Vallitalea pronyensis]|uniref:Pyridoxamine 5'-phosphate oxidase family protein n=1 Tax=Vallitalea pronyensis TaxID=1348613 RepID=A0A8J8MFN6_9FIRM|nr:pyridoxamine 5'-phosphate oxidase family protein [Vallitalea pronyensis]QUI20795.1 pyridoxamine 5'-phosphate oxidase family protein [Vallitalea pronyensis]